MKKDIIVGDRKIGDDQPTFIIAEAGVNHNGDINVAYALVDEAISANADAVKFQSYNTEEIIIEGIEKAPYQKEKSVNNEDQVEMLKELELTDKNHELLIDYCKSKGIIFISTPYDYKSLSLLIELNIPLIKIASTDTTNVLFLKKIAKLNTPVILSTGMSTLEEIRLSYNVLNKNGAEDIVLMKCTSEYPSSIESSNLLGIQSLKNEFNGIVGFSDHSEGIEAALYAVAFGAKVIEKHFTLDKKMKGPDHKASLDSAELRRLVSGVRRIERIMGNGKLVPTAAELINKKSLQKNLVASVDLSKGEVISEDLIVAKRTGGKGIPAINAFNIIGKKTLRSLHKNEIITESEISD